MALLMLEAGLRVGEVVQLHPENLWYYSNPIQTIRISTIISKNRMERYIPASARLQKSFQEMDRAFWQFLSNHAITYAFYQKNANKPLTTRQVERIIRAASMRALGRPIHPHALRHTFASRLMRKVNIRIVQELLGHKSITSTQVYTHPNGDDLKKAIDSVEDIDEEKLPRGVQLFRPAGVANRGNTSGTNQDIR
jgi:integrase/recombinase XerC